MLRISSIKIEGLADGCITDRKPNISFALESDIEGETLQSAVIYSGDWKIKTNDQINNLYSGEMKPFSKYTIHVKAIGTSGESAEGYAEFETGRLDMPWQAKWITDGSYDYPDVVSPQPMTFRYKFKLDKKIKKAWVNATALGVYELEINGQKVGIDYFAPGFTSYYHQIQYQTYDATKMLHAENTIIAAVAGGWAAGSFNNIRKNKISADKQAFLCEVHIEYTDGTRETICTDENWKVTEDGNFKLAEWYDGETYDARVILDKIEWKNVSITEPRKTPNIIAQYGPPVRVQQVMKPISSTIAPSGEIIYDFGQNFAGVISAKINGKSGQTVVFRHAEVIVDQELFVKSLRTAKATATYICVDGEQTYSPRLTYMGFRYVGMSGIEAEKVELTALVLYSEIEEVGTFECSNKLLNKLNNNIKWGGKSNFVDIPTDCPQRDERQGWTGDFCVFAGTACYNFDMSRFLDKWLLDMKAEQKKSGDIPVVIPRAGNNFPVMSTACWSDSCILVPWEEYLARGNKELLIRQYETMKKHLKSVKRWASLLSFTPKRSRIWVLPLLWGDWCAPEGTAQQWVMKNKWLATAYYANSCGVISDIADLLGYNDDAAHYRKLRNKIIKAFRDVLTDGKGNIKKGFQSAYVLPLRFGMTKGEETSTMVENLVKLIKEANNHLGTGFPATPHILFALSDNGRVDEAFDLLFQDTCPSWLYMVKSGGTTIWERWDSLRPDGTVNISELSGDKSDEESSGGMVSFNHYAAGAVGNWLYKRIAGIEPTSGGYKTYKIAPLIGGGISWAKGNLITPYGKVSSFWKIKEDEFTISVTVPVSTECNLVMPDKTEYLLKSGNYTYSCKI